MSQPADEDFYATLEPFDQFVEVAEARHYRPLPDSWLVILTDVRGSTDAIEAGRYKDVNAVGVASIVALRNAVNGLAIPFVFGGDGATVLVPASRREVVESALRGIREMARSAFDLELRAGIVPVATLRADGFDLQVARYRSSADVDLAMLSGSGLPEAERRIKHAEEGAAYHVSEEGPSEADFTGFECRWRPIPSRRGAVVSLLVQACGEDPAGTYRRVLDAIQSILAEAAPGRPVHPSTLLLQRFGDTFDQEAKIRGGAAKGLGVFARSFVAKLASSIGSALLARGWNALGFPGAVYRDEVVANTDFRKFDDTLRMVIDIGPEQQRAIESMLEAEHAAGHLVYGIHESPTSIMTCAIGDYRGDHVHFVDGADGGYALAAKAMKRQLREGG